MKTIDSNINCPSCQEPLKPQVLVCKGCEIKVEGNFQLNEFATLSPDDLHFLRIFVHCEGRVRDMESSLGLSYPTIRARLTALKNKLTVAPFSNELGKEKMAEDADANSDRLSATQKILGRLEKGELSFDQAMSEIKKARKE